MSLNLTRVLILAVALSLIGVAVAAQTAAAPPVPGEMLKPGDIVQLRIWREPDLSGEFPVDENGSVMFPKIGALPATDESPDALETRLISLYQRYLRNPSIEVVFLRRVTVLGAVNKPGVYTIAPTATLADALAMAGGTSPQGDPDKLEIQRAGTMLQTRVSQRTRIADSPIRSGDQLFVPERSWIRRNSGLVASVISAATSIAIAFIVSK